MKQSKRKRIEQLEAQLADKDGKISCLEDLVANYRYKIEDMQKTIESTPEDCVPGEYCRACSFAKMYAVRNTCLELEYVYFCGKAGSCRNFVQGDVNQ